MMVKIHPTSHDIVNEKIFWGNYIKKSVFQSFIFREMEKNLDFALFPIKPFTFLCKQFKAIESLCFLWPYN